MAAANNTAYTIAISSSSFSKRSYLFILDSRKAILNQIQCQERTRALGANWPCNTRMEHELKHFFCLRCCSIARAFLCHRNINAAAHSIHFWPRHYSCDANTSVLGLTVSHRVVKRSKYFPELCPRLD